MLILDSRTLGKRGDLKKEKKNKNFIPFTILKDKISQDENFRHSIDIMKVIGK